MKTSYAISAVLMLAMLSTLFGCAAGVEPPKPYSVRELKSGALLFLEKVEATLERKGGITQTQTRRLAVHLNWLRRHMETTGVGTEEQRRALDDALRALSGRAGFQGPPPDWKPGDETPDEPLVKPGPLKELLPQVREILESVPDSDKRPEFD